MVDHLEEVPVSVKSAEFRMDPVPAEASTEIRSSIGYSNCEGVKFDNVTQGKPIIIRTAVCQDTEIHGKRTVKFVGKARVGRGGRLAKREPAAWDFDNGIGSAGRIGRFLTPNRGSENRIQHKERPMVCAHGTMPFLLG